MSVGKKAKNILFLYNLDENLPKLPLVSDQIQQVFVNILINAVDAITDRQLSSPETINGEIVVDTSFLDDSIFISFTDNGIGIPENNVSKYSSFSPKKYQGTGWDFGYDGMRKSFQRIKRKFGINGTTFKFHPHLKFIKENYAGKILVVDDEIIFENLYPYILSKRDMGG
jgi:hypothetical protein